MSCLPKPVLRGHVKRAGLKTICGGIAFALFNSSLYYFLVKVPRKEAEKNFFESYDAEAHLRDLIKWGYLQSVKKDTS